MAKIFNSTLDETTGYIFKEDGDLEIVNKTTGEPVYLGIDEQEILEDASKAYIKNDVYVPEVEVETAKPETDDRKVKEPIKTIEPEEVEVEDDIKHQLEAKDFGEYLIVIGDYAEKDFDVFVGTKAELNDHIADLHLHETPKVYALKQLPVRTKYEVL